MGPVVCVVSDMWRVSGMWGSVVCGSKWDAGSVVCCGQCYVGEVVWNFFRSVVYLRSVVYCEGRQ